MLGCLPHNTTTRFKRNCGFHQYSSSLFYVTLSLFTIPAANEHMHMASPVLACRYTQQLVLNFILSLQLSILFYIKISLEPHVLCVFSQFFPFLFRLSTWKRYANASPGSQLTAPAEGSAVTSLGLQRKIPHSSVAVEW